MGQSIGSISIKLTVDKTGALNAIKEISERISEVKVNAEKLSGSFKSMTGNISKVGQSMNPINNSVNKMSNGFTRASRSMKGIPFSETLSRQKELTNKASRFNNESQKSAGIFSGMKSKIGAAAGVLAAIKIGKVGIETADQMTGINSRLNLIKSSDETLVSLQDKIFQAAKSSRGEYTAMAATVGKLGVVAKGAFSGTDEMILFTEQLNKQFKIAGASGEESSAAMYQLTQAMASGRLQGDEFRSVMENAPMLAQGIATALKVDVGQLKELAAEGKITSDVIKSGLLASANETNATFAKIPKTFSDIMQDAKNRLLSSFRPVFEKLTELANSPQFQTMINIVINNLASLANLAVVAIGIISNVISWLANNFSGLLPYINAVAFAFLFFKAVVSVTHIVLAAYNFLTKLVAASTSIFTTVQKIATASQAGFNAALLACPISWIILGIVAIILAFYGLIEIINKVTGSSISATGVITGVLFSGVAFIWNLFVGFGDFVLGIVSAVWNGFATFANFLGNMFQNPISSVIKLFGGMAGVVLNILHSIARCIDAVFGSNFSSTVEGWKNNVSSMEDSLISTLAPNEHYEERFEKVDYSMGDAGMTRWDYGDAYQQGYATGEAIDDGVGNLVNDIKNMFSTDLGEDKTGMNVDTGPIDVSKYQNPQLGAGTADTNPAKVATDSNDKMNDSLKETDDIISKLSDKFKSLRDGIKSAGQSFEAMAYKIVNKNKLLAASNKNLAVTHEFTNGYIQLMGNKQLSEVSKGIISKLGVEDLGTINALLSMNANQLAQWDKNNAGVSALANSAGAVAAPITMNVEIHEAKDADAVATAIYEKMKKAGMI